jgi:hypothetical protein
MDQWLQEKFFMDADRVFSRHNPMLGTCGTVIPPLAVESVDLIILQGMRAFVHFARRRH